MGEKIGEKIGEKSAPVVRGENQQFVKTFRFAKTLKTRAGHVSKFRVETFLPSILRHGTTLNWAMADGRASPVWDDRRAKKGKEFISPKFEPQTWLVQSCVIYQGKK